LTITPLPGFPGTHRGLCNRNWRSGRLSANGAAPGLEAQVQLGTIAAGLLSGRACRDLGGIRRGALLTAWVCFAVEAIRRERAGVLERETPVKVSSISASGGRNPVFVYLIAVSRLIKIIFVVKMAVGLPRDAGESSATVSTSRARRTGTVIQL